MRSADDHVARDTPPAVVGAVTAGTVPLPFLAVYAVLFIIHGGFHHSVPPDVTTTDGGELVVGLVCLVIFVVGTVTELWMLGGRLRWPFVIVQAAFLAVSIDFLVDETKGGRVVSGLVAVTSFVALVLSAHPQAWDHLHRRCPRWLARAFGRGLPAREPHASLPAGATATSAETPVSARLIPRRRSPRRAEGVDDRG